MFPEITRDDVFRLETPRLRLAWPCADDARGHYLHRLARRGRGHDRADPSPLSQRRRECLDFASRRDNMLGRSLTLVAREKGGCREVVALLGIDLLAGGPELGYVVKPERWGKAWLARPRPRSSAVTFAVTGLPIIHSRTRIENGASQRVLRKIGFAEAGQAMADMPARGGRFPVQTFRLERSDWLAQMPLGEAMGAGFAEGALAEA
jgi:RimJ/RimL family protein N-acetyltransferase